jgi:hypothetical protein
MSRQQELFNAGTKFKFPAFLSDRFLLPAPDAHIACGMFGWAFNIAAAFYVFPGLKVSNDGLFQIIFQSAPDGSDHVDVSLFCIFAQTGFPPVYGGQRFSNDCRSGQAEKPFFHFLQEPENCAVAAVYDRQSSEYLLSVISV